MDTIEREADSLRTGNKRPGDEISPAPKKPRVEVPRPRWIDQPQGNVIMHGGYNQPELVQAWLPWQRPLQRRPLQGRAPQLTSVENVKEEPFFYSAMACILS